MIIYKVTNLINNKVYIGLTIQTLEIRKGKHISKSFNSNSNLVFHKALRKYGKENFEWETIDTANCIEELKEKEKYWISFYNSYNDGGYNSTIGGEGTIGYKRPDESNQKISEKLKKNGKVKGSNNPKSKLTEENVLQIKEMIKERITFSKIAQKFKVHVSVITKIKNGITWSNVGEDLSNINYFREDLTEEEVKEIKLLIKQGIKQKEIALKFNISESCISKIKKGKSWSDIGEDLSKQRTATYRLTEDEVREIKVMLKEEKLKVKEIAEKFNISSSVVNKIKLDRLWKHIS